MKNTLIAFLLLTFFSSCDDGNFEIPSFEFETTVNHCGEHVLYKLSSSKTEALILTLTASNIQNAVTTLPLPIEIAITAENVNYRVFSSEISTNYFCASVPPTQPIVTQNWLAVSGSLNKISIQTTEVLDINGVLTAYKHAITLKNLLLVNNGETIIHESYDFGFFETTI